MLIKRKEEYHRIKSLKKKLFFFHFTIFFGCLQARSELEETCKGSEGKVGGGAMFKVQTLRICGETRTASATRKTLMGTTTVIRHA